MTASPVYLRALELGDVERIHRWHSDPALFEWLAGTFWHVARANVEEWLRKRQAAGRQEVNLAICRTEDDEHVGNIYLREIDWVARHGELHIFLGDAGDRGKGLGRAAVRQLVDYAFSHLGLQRVFLFVLADNAAARRAYEACGFVVEGCLRRHAFKRGGCKDVLVMGLLRDAA
jgi:RimJ/RimL family protein N-acetyltransferase